MEFPSLSQQEEAEKGEEELPPGVCRPHSQGDGCCSQKVWNKGPAGPREELVQRLRSRGAAEGAAAGPRGGQPDVWGMAACVEAACVDSHKSVLSIDHATLGPKQALL